MRIQREKYFYQRKTNTDESIINRILLKGNYLVGSCSVFYVNNAVGKRKRGTSISNKLRTLNKALQWIRTL